MEFVIGIDGGGTQTRAWLTALDGSVITRADSGGSNAHLHGVEASCSMLVEAVAKARTSASRNGVALDAKPRAVVAGVAGAGAASDQKAISSRLAAALLVDAKQCIVDHDLRIALAAGVGGDPGLVLVAGTGSACYGRVREGLSWICGGWGPGVDDAGSGYWIGLQGMRIVVRAADGRANPTPLTDALLAELGVGTTREMIDRLRDSVVAGTDRAVVASLAPLVIAAAEAGDMAAASILEQGAAEFALMASAVVKRLAREAEPLHRGVTAGGVLEHRKFYFEMVKRAVRHSLPDLSLEPVALPPVAGAVLLALEVAAGSVSPEIRERIASTGPRE